MRPPGFFFVASIHFCRSDWPPEQPAATRPASTAPMTPALRVLLTSPSRLFLWPARAFIFYVAVGLGGHVHGQIIVAALGIHRRDLDVVQRDDARQCGDAADKIAEVVICPDQLDSDRQLGVKAVALLAARLKELFLQPRGETGLRNVDQKIRNLGL